MRLRHIEIFFTVWRTGSVTAAAEELAISQSSISKTLKHAEQYLGFDLFHRVRGKLVLTAEGEVLLNDAERIFEALERVRGQAKNLKNGIARSIRTVCLPSLGMWLVPEAVRRFRLRHPATPLEIATKHEGEMLEGLRTKQFDLAFGFGPSERAPAIPGISMRRLAAGRLVYITPSSESSRQWGRPIDLDDIDCTQLIGLNGQHFLGSALHSALKARGLPDQPHIQVQTYYIARALAANGTGAAIVDEFTAMTEPERILVQPIEPAISFGLYVYYREDRLPSRHAAALIDEVIAASRSLRRDRPLKSPPQSRPQAAPPARRAIQPD